MAEPGAYVTLVANADYGTGALTLARALRRLATPFPLVMLATSGSLAGLDALERERYRSLDVDRLPLSAGFAARHARTAQHAAVPFTKGEKPDFHDPLDNFVKLRLWELEEYPRVVFLDADTLVLRSIDRLMDYPEFAAAPNLYETLADFHRLNSGVFVARPDARTFHDMLDRLDDGSTFWRRTDQSFLESYFPDWHGLPWTMNALQYVYFDLPGLWHWPAIRVINCQYEKPWTLPLQPLIDLWWAIHEKRPLPAGVD